MPLIAHASQVDRSSIAWPLTGTGTLLVSVSSLICTGLVALAIYGTCESTGGCDGSIWSDVVWGTPRNFTKMCESIHPERFMMQRTNSVSNLCFSFVGFFLMGIGVADWSRKHVLAESSPETTDTKRDDSDVNRIHHARNHIVLNGRLSVFFGLVFHNLGALSFIFHSRMTDFTDRLDITGISITMSAGIVYSLMMLFWNPDGPGSAAKQWSYATGCIVLMGGISPALVLLDTAIGSVFATGVSASVVIILQFVIWVAHKKESLRSTWFPGVSNWRLRQWKLAILIATLLGIAFVFKTLDHGWSGCEPEGYFQMHSLWHFTSSVALGLIYILFRSEAANFANSSDAVVSDASGSFQLGMSLEEML